jgi:2-keto-4-pentenoate hydratase/2-oxohepta-3-ene-1,7-dioic acid hydratase in catechol pathway
MKFATALRHGKLVAGVVDPKGQLFWPLTALTPALPADAAADLVLAIPHLTKIGALPDSEAWPLAEMELTAPLPRPPHNVLCVGKNYHAHAHEFAQSGFDSSAGTSHAVPDVPIIFTKPSSAISGPNADIPLTPGLDEAVDYDVELAVVIGKAGRAILRDQAMAHVFGYTIINDVTARDLQQRHKQWFLGKSIDGFCPMGPWIVSKDECDLGQMRVICRVNGETR